MHRDRRPMRAGLKHLWDDRRDQRRVKTQRRDCSIGQFREHRTLNGGESSGRVLQRPER